jgi:hypothetical protein
MGSFPHAWLQTPGNTYDNRYQGEQTFNNWHVFHDATSQLKPTRTTKINTGSTEFLYVFSPKTTDILMCVATLCLFFKSMQVGLS